MLWYPLEHMTFTALIVSLFGMNGAMASEHELDCIEIVSKHQTTLYSNGDSPKQLLARSRYILYKNQEKWTPKQKERAEILFKHYPDIEKAYKLSQGLKLIFNQNIIKDIARVKLAKWYNDVEASGFKAFNIVSNTIKLNSHAYKLCEYICRLFSQFYNNFQA